MRKASVFCLVSIYLIAGESLRPHLSELNGSKVRAGNSFVVTIVMTLGGF